MTYHRLFSAIILSCALSLPAHAAEPPAEPPQLIIEAPTSLTPLTTRVQNMNKARVQAVMTLVGVEQPGNPIRVIIAPEQSDWARHAPSWVSGYAISEQDLIVLLPERVLGYPYDSFESLFEHELAHILIGRAAGGQSVPRWFDEGLAMVAAHSWKFDDRARLVWAMLTGEQTSLTELDNLFRKNGDSARHAYVLSHAFIRYCLRQYGSEWPKQLLTTVSQGYSFHAAFAHTTSHSLEHATAQFWDQQSLWSRWIPVATSSGVLWVGIIVLALYVFKKQRQRAEAVKRQWREDDWDF